MKRENMGHPKYKRFVLAGFCFFIVLAGVLLGCEKEEGTYFSLQQVAKIQPENVTGLNLTYLTPYPSVDVTDATERKELLAIISEIPIQRQAIQPGDMDGGWNLRFLLTNPDGSIKQVDISKDSLKITTIDSNGNRKGRDVYYDISPSFDADSFIQNVVNTYGLEWISLPTFFQGEILSSNILNVQISENGGKQTVIENPDQIQEIASFLSHVTLQNKYTERNFSSTDENGGMGVYFLITYSDQSTVHIQIDPEKNQVSICGHTYHEDIQGKWRDYPLVYHSEKEQSEQQEWLNEILSMSAAD